MARDKDYKQQQNHHRLHHLADLPERCPLAHLPNFITSSHPNNLSIVLYPNANSHSGCNLCTAL
jgi:hypothetical protein